jgi:hypothetical protein
MIKDGWKQWQSYEEACGSPIPLYDEDWGAGGPIIEREIDQISRLHSYPEYTANRYACDSWEDCEALGPTPLVAAMRCYVASKLGEEVDIPKELMQ